MMWWCSFDGIHDILAAGVGFVIHLLQKLKLCNSVCLVGATMFVWWVLFIIIICFHHCFTFAFIIASHLLSLFFHFSFHHSFIFPFIFFIYSSSSLLFLTQFHCHLSSADNTILILQHNSTSAFFIFIISFINTMTDQSQNLLSLQPASQSSTSFMTFQLTYSDRVFENVSSL